MKKYIILLVTILFLFSCSDNKDNEIWVIEETGQILSGYVDNLEESIVDAKAVRELMDKNYENMWKVVEELK